MPSLALFGRVQGPILVVRFWLGQLAGVCVCVFVCVNVCVCGASLPCNEFLHEDALFGTHAEAVVLVVVLLLLLLLLLSLLLSLLLMLWFTSRLFSYLHKHNRRGVTKYYRFSKNCRSKTIVFQKTSV
mmetsp:Transcript_42197/g.105490  ORF Transcript_42197/g.105490 Transcript_42197/m.105490 type:complete len:128 (-) Transcript_42197:995-1378(-)